jgi:hypothetical protein
MAAVKYTGERLAEAARVCSTYDEVVRWFGGDPTPGSRRYVRRRLLAEGISIAHFAQAHVRHTDERLGELVRRCSSVAEVVRELGINSVGGNQAHIGRRIKRLGIDTSHFRIPPPRSKRSLENLLELGNPADGRVPGERLRRALLARGLPEECGSCGIGPQWQGEPLRLELDHRNGNWWDNRPQNLQMLCPNCHATTDTYRGRKQRKAKA